MLPTGTSLCGGPGGPGLGIPSPRPAGPVRLLGATSASAGRACREPGEQLALNE